MTHLRDNFQVEEEKISIDGIPCLRLIPKGKEGDLPTVIFYHGLGSDKESQRMRGYMLAFAGYQVFMPDAIHHGERDVKFTEDPIQLSKYFWQAILQSLEESETLIGQIVDVYRGDRKNIFVTGHSMGGFISAGVFTHNQMVKAAAPLNGSFNWAGSNDSLRRVHGHEGIKIREEVQVDRLDPMVHMDKIVGRNVLILHGEKDPEVDINPQRDFYRLVSQDMEGIGMIEYENLGHFCTTNMMEDLIKWLKGLA